MNHPDTDRVYSAGRIAYDLLQTIEQASVQGTTSRGLFLKFSSEWIVFLSYESYKGPLTLNFLGEKNKFQALEIGSPVKCTRDQLYFPTLDLSIYITDTVIWQSPGPPDYFFPVDMRTNFLKSVHRLMKDIPLDDPIASSLAAILDVPVASTPIEPIVLQNILFLQNACRATNLLWIEDALMKFIGWGTGLTPSGDDLITGFLLGINRWGKKLMPYFQTEGLNQKVVDRVKNQTGTLSVNLIECASLGEADERLILPLDGIVTGSINAVDCINYLAGWGSTSGFDALVGMAIFATTRFELQPVD